MTVPIRQAVIWGHPLHSHTHSYIHQGFFRAFRRLEIPTYLVNDSQKWHGPTKDTLFLTEGSVCERMPISRDALYVIHNPKLKYDEIWDRILTIQVYTKDSISFEGSDLAPFCKLHAGNTLFFPWATDLLPEEIHAGNAADFSSKQAWFVGTITKSGQNTNYKEIVRFAEGCRKHGIEFHYCGIYSDHRDTYRRGGAVDDTSAHQMIRNSCVAPAIQSEFQKKMGYIPCRIFKNISYGHYGATNNPFVRERLHPDIICREDPAELLEATLELQARDQDRKILRELMSYVRDHHTFVNRVQQILKTFGEIL